MPKQFNYKNCAKIFNRAYGQFYWRKPIAQEHLDKLDSYDIPMEDFQRLTTNRELARYITLVDGKIRFDSIPNAPHGELIGCLTQLFYGFEGLNGVADNGKITSYVY